MIIPLLSFKGKLVNNKLMMSAKVVELKKILNRVQSNSKLPNRSLNNISVKKINRVSTM